MAQMFSSGDGYEEHMGRHSRKLAPLFADFAQVRDAGSLLDVGCGTGSLTQVLAERTHDAKLSGVDPSKDFVDFARTRFGANKRITIDQGNALDLPYPDKCFDQTLSLLVLMFIPDREKAVTELKRVTKPLGTVAACVWDKGGMKMAVIFWEEALKIDPSAETEKMSQRYQEGELSRLWGSNGLANVVETSIEIQMEFDSFDDYWRREVSSGGPMSAYAAELSPEHLEVLRLALKKRHLGDRPNGPYVLPAKSLAVRGMVPG